MPMGELRRFKMLGSQNAKDFGDWWNGRAAYVYFDNQ